MLGGAPHKDKRRKDWTQRPVIEGVLRFWLLAVAVLLVTYNVAAMADTAVEDTPPAQTITTPAPKAPIINTLIATVEPDVTVTVEGVALPQSTVSRDENGALFVRAEPIFTALGDDYEFDAETSALVVRRPQDGVVMELYTDTGLVKANGKPIGKLRVFGEVTEESITLTPNAIAVLAGANPKEDKMKGILHFELDSRLRVATGYQLYVNDAPLDNIQPEAKSVGPVLLLPLLPIAKELGHYVSQSPDNSTVTVRRAQDSATFELDLSTGLVKQNGRPIGVSKDVTYIDAVNLLIPTSALETLTGTHVYVEPGSDRIEISLDERLTGALAPGENVNAKVADEPFTVETLTFHTGTDTQTSADLTFRAKKINGRVRYEIPEFPDSAGALEPGWLSLDYRHLEGPYGSIGDVSADLRQLDGVGLRRIRGASLTKESQDSRWSGVIGTPVSGSKRIEGSDQTRLEFAGLAAGLRYADKEGWEAGASYKKDGISDDQMAVLSAISGRLGRKTDKPVTWSATGDLGVFKGEARQSGVDVRLNGTARYDVSKTIDIDAFAGYTGAEFLRNELSREALEQSLVENDENQEDSTDTSTLPDIRITGQDQMTLGASVQYSAGRKIGILAHPGAALRVQETTSGVRVGDQAQVSVSSFGVTASTGLADTGVNLTADYTAYNQTSKTAPQDDETGQALNLRAFQRNAWGTVRGQYTWSQRGDDQARERLDLSASSRAFTYKGHEGLTVTAAPSLAATWTPDRSFVRGGIIANADSGQLFGPKTRAQASLGVLQSFGGDIEKNADTFFTASLARELRINKNLALSLSYRNDLRGEQRIGINLDGRYDFNARRKYSLTEEGRGVLKGRAFYDKNRDGIRQEGEPGIGGMIVRVQGGRKKLALKTDGEGYFTIQNIMEGLHKVHIDNRSLPLGFALGADTQVKATIREGHITTMDLPIVQRGQVRGFAFIDSNSDGDYQPSEIRLEGARLRLTSAVDADDVHETVSTSFGQYAFDDLPAGDYMLEILATNTPDAQALPAISVTLEGEDELMAKVKLAARASHATLLANKEDNPDPPPDDPKEPSEQGKSETKISASP